MGLILMCPMAIVAPPACRYCAMLVICRWQCGTRFACPGLCYCIARCPFPCIVPSVWIPLGPAGAVTVWWVVGLVFRVPRFCILMAQ